MKELTFRQATDEEAERILKALKNQKIDPPSLLKNPRLFTKYWTLKLAHLPKGLYLKLRILFCDFMIWYYR